MSNKNWENNELQFARLLHEIEATQDIEYLELIKQMDLTMEDMLELFDRAQKVFQEHKEKNFGTNLSERQGLDSSGRLGAKKNEQ